MMKQRAVFDRSNDNDEAEVIVDVEEDDGSYEAYTGASVWGPGGTL